MSGIKVLKILLINLLIISILPFPHWCYYIIKFGLLVGFGILFNYHNNRVQYLLSLIYIVLMILYQPVFAVLLSKNAWILLDIIIILFLQISFLFEVKKIENDYSFFGDENWNLVDQKRIFLDFVKPKLTTKFGRIIIIITWVITIASVFFVGYLAYDGHQKRDRTDEEIEYDDYSDDRGHSGDY